MDERDERTEDEIPEDQAGETEEIGCGGDENAEDSTQEINAPAALPAQPTSALLDWLVPGQFSAPPAPAAAAPSGLTAQRKTELKKHIEQAIEDHKLGNRAAPLAGSKKLEVKEYLYPFRIRYGGEFVDLESFTPIRFEPGTTYSEAKIKEILIDNHYPEFKTKKPEFHFMPEINAMAVTIEGSKKGGRAFTLSAASLRWVELAFKETYAANRTEDRLLIYADENGALHAPIRMPMKASRVEVLCDVDQSFFKDGHLYDLVFDFHSHHRMGAFWSPTDNANERLRGPIFGVSAWNADGSTTWLFRRFTGEGYSPEMAHTPMAFENLTYEEVIRP